MAILDFTKAFDKVPHKRLIHKLNYYGISGSIATLIETFLIGRTQQVVVNGATSSSTIVTSGVPQGTGPLLFLLYINDLPDNLSTNIGSLQMSVFYIHLSEHKMTLPYSRTIYLNYRNGKTNGLWNSSLVNVIRWHYSHQDTCIRLTCIPSVDKLWRL